MKTKHCANSRLCISNCYVDDDEAKIFQGGDDISIHFSAFLSHDEGDDLCDFYPSLAVTFEDRQSLTIFGVLDGVANITQLRDYLTSVISIYNDARSSEVRDTTEQL